MADSFVEVTEGSGKTVDTRTEGTNGNHRQVIIIGDPATNAGVAPVDATNGLAVDVKASALPSGSATSAKQDTIIGHLDGVEGLLTTIDGDTGNISTKIDTLAGAVSGTEFQVDVLTMPSTAVTNAGLTELAAAINSDKVDVNIASSGISFGGTSAADDADFTAGTTPGTPAMGVYESTPTSVTDGDLGTVGITAGRRLKTSATIDAALPAGTNNIGDVDVLSSALPTGASTSAKQDTVIGHLDGVETLLGTIDADTSDIHTNSDTIAAGFAAEAAALGSGVLLQGDDGTDRKNINVDATTGDVQVDVTNTVTVDLGANNDVTVTGTVDLGATDNAVLDAIAASVAAIDTDATTIIGHVDGLEALIGTTNTNTAATTTALQIMDDWDNGASDGASVSGDVAHDSADAGEPVKIGMKAYSPDGTTPGTAVAENDRTNAKSDLDGRLFVNNRSPQQKHKHLNGTSAYTDEAIAASPGAGFQTVITSIIVSTGAATAMNFFLEEGGTTIFGPIYLEATAGRGFVSGPIYLPVTAATAVTITTSAAIAQSVDIDYFVQAV